jgi:hypothetical protein
MIQRLKETQSNIEGQIADLSTSLLDGHPRLKGLRSQLTGISEQIRRETKKVLASLESEASVSRDREKQLIGQLGNLKADTDVTEERQVGLKALEREAAAQRQLLETYLARYREAVSRQDMNATPADGRIISNATVPAEPYFPKVLPITIVAALAGFILSSVFVMLSELFSGRAIRYTEFEEEDEDEEIVEVPPSRAVAAPAKAAQVPAKVAQDIEVIPAADAPIASSEEKAKTKLRLKKRRRPRPRACFRSNSMRRSSKPAWKRQPRTLSTKNFPSMPWLATSSTPTSMSLLPCHSRAMWDRPRR